MQKRPSGHHQARIYANQIYLDLWSRLAVQSLRKYTFEDDDTGFVDSNHAATVLAGQPLDANELREVMVETIKRMEAQ